MEEKIKKNFIKNAKEKLNKINCKKIAITGSFGKTSTKNILYQILKEEYDVCVSPQSYNTPMGVCKTILENLKETDDFLIVEFGARHIGDIEFLSKMVGVDYGIVTPIGNCHLKTFKTIENIEKTKYELCQNAKEAVVFNGTSESTRKLFSKFEHTKYLVCQENSFAYAKDIVTNEYGSKFVLVIDENEIICQTKLLGKANIDNIVVASAMTYLLKESFYSIAKAIEKLKPVPHRLEIIDGKNIKVIDDSYNSNFDGFLQALSILNNLNGRKKIVVSPGIVELGKKQYETNFEIGKEVGKVADVFLIMNETNKKALSDGAKVKNNMKILYANSRNKQKEILKEIAEKGDIILFENDFPDNIK